MSLPSVADLFTQQEGLIYLNSGSHSRTPLEVLSAVEHYLREYEKNPTYSLLRASEKLWDVQTRVAEFFGAQPEDVFLRPNVTLPLNNFILDLKLPIHSEILTSDLEYGAIANLVRFRAERDGLRTRTLTLPASSEEFLKVDSTALAKLVIDELRPETSLLVLSHVMTGTGLTLPLAEIAKVTRERGILLVIDGAHAPGALELDFKKLDDVDFYAGNLHKWMMAPKGTAFGWVHPSKQHLIQPSCAGWMTYEWPPPFKNFAPGSEFGRTFLMTGCFDFAPYFAIDECLKFWKRLGPENIRHRIFELQSYAENLMTQKLGWKPLSPPQGSMRGPLLSFEVPEKLQAKDGLELVYELVDQHKLQIMMTMVRGRSALRLSPHIYNTESEINRAVEILKTL